MGFCYASYNIALVEDACPPTRYESSGRRLKRFCGQFSFADRLRRERQNKKPDSSQTNNTLRLPPLAAQPHPACIAVLRGARPSCGCASVRGVISVTTVQDLLNHIADCDALDDLEKFFLSDMVSGLTKQRPAPARVLKFKSRIRGNREPRGS
jgi:hypothetical protein